MGWESKQNLLRPLQAVK